MKSSKDSKKDSKSEIEKRDARILVRPIFFHKLLNLMTKHQFISDNDTENLCMNIHTYVDIFNKPK